MPGAPLANGHEGRILAVAKMLGAQLSEATIARIAAWFDLLCVWNAKIDLTAARTPDELADLLLADALVLARHHPRGERVVDVGAGAGAPGLALHLLRPDLRVTLVEPMQKRISFLRTVMGELGASTPEGGGLAVVRARGEELAARGPGFGSAISRATLPPDAWLTLSAKLVVPGGSAWVLLAREEPPSLAGWQADVDEFYEWPLTRAKRRAVRYKEAVSTRRGHGA